MNIELMYYLFLGEVFAMVYTDQHILLRKNVPTMSIKKSEIFFTLVYMPTSKNKYDRVTGIYAITNIRDWAYFDEALGSMRSKGIEGMYHQGNFKVVDIYILFWPPVFQFLGETLDAGLENEGALNRR